MRGPPRRRRLQKAGFKKYKILIFLIFVRVGRVYPGPTRGIPIIGRVRSTCEQWERHGRSRRAVVAPHMHMATSQGVRRPNLRCECVHKICMGSHHTKNCTGPRHSEMSKGPSEIGLRPLTVKSSCAGLMRPSYFKRGVGSVQPGCILGGLRFWSTAIRFLNLYGVFNSRFSTSFFLRNGSN
jgi:hypothetical protein